MTKHTKAYTVSELPKPALNPEARENQVISAAIALAEKQIIEGTASSQVITHFLKLGSMKAQAEKALIDKQIELADAKIEALKSQKYQEELYENALKAMRRYSGNFEEEE